MVSTTYLNLQSLDRHGGNSCTSEEMAVDLAVQAVDPRDADAEAPEEVHILEVEASVEEDEMRVAPEPEQKVVEVQLVERRGLQTPDDKESRHMDPPAEAVVHRASQEQTTEQGHPAMGNDE